MSFPTVSVVIGRVIHLTVQNGVKTMCGRKITRGKVSRPSQQVPCRACRKRVMEILSVEDG